MSTFKNGLAVGPVWSNDIAQKIGGPVAAAHFGKFTGVWTTIVPGKMSVVEVEFDTDRKTTHEFVTDVIAGPIWNNENAKEMCPFICASYGGEWNGQWKTIVEGKMSVCGCIFRF